MTLMCSENFTWLEIFIFLVPAIEKLDSAIQWTNYYPADI